MKFSLLALAAAGIAAASTLRVTPDARSSDAVQSTEASTAGVRIPLLAAGGAHFVEVAIGTPPQKFHVRLDTASYELGVVSTSCVEQCDISVKLNTSASSTYVGSDKFIGMGYGSGSVQGKVGTDIVSLGGYTNPAQAFAVLSKSDPGMIGAFLPGSGIMGMSIMNESSASTGSVQAGTPFWLALAQSRQIQLPLFTLKLARQKSELPDPELLKKAKFSPGGALTLGVVDKKQYSGPITYTNALYTDSWLLPLESMKLNGKNIDFPKTTKMSNAAIIDSGAPLIIAPSSLIAGFYAQIPGSERIDGEGERYAVPCNTTAHVSFSFGGGKEWSLQATDIADAPLGKADKGKEYCFGAVYGIGADKENSRMPAWNFGSVFLQNVFSVFDAGSDTQPAQIGFATPS